MRCMHGVSINVACEDCKQAQELPEDGWYRIICFSPDGVAKDEYQRIRQSDGEVAK
jgi:hypothetical protein